jgi:hypothetical protein
MDERWVDRLIEELLMSRSYAESLDLVRRVANERTLTVGTVVRPSEDVQAMGGVSVFQLETEHVVITADTLNFQITDAGSSPCIRGIAGLPKDAKVFLRWVQENEHRLSQTTFADLVRSLTLVGIRGSDVVSWHEFC